MPCPGGEAGNGAGLAPAHTAGGGRKGVLMIAGVGKEGGADLAKVGDVASAVAKFLGLSQSRNGHGADQAENDDNNQELDKGKSTSRYIGLVAGGWLSVVGW